MAVTTNKSLLFLAGGVAAAAVVAYSAGMFSPPMPETIAALPGSGEADSKDARLPAAEQPAATPQAPEQPAAPEASAPAAQEPAASGSETETPAESGPPATEQAVVPPSFDVVRVEGNGSIVVAGEAAANAKVDLLVGSNVIGSATADAGGDFAVVLDDPLKPGDYQIVLRATAPDNVVAMSVETAVVSVPETPEGQVLALVEEPGKPAQMITLPAPQAPAAEVKPPAEASAAGTPAAEAPAAAQPVPGAEQQAALPKPAESAPVPAPPPAGPAVRVEAVEIDGRKIFVAGTADPGRTLRGYANEILLGDAKASPDGRYLIEAERDLPVGDYIIRVDALEPDGVKVAARAAVPFEREPGETIAAVAPPAQETVTPPAAAAPAAEAPAAAAPATEGTDTGGTAPAVATPPAEQPAAGGQAPAAPAAEAPAAVAETPAAEAPAGGTPQAPAQTETPAAGASGSQAAQPAPAQPAQPPSAVAEAPAGQAPAGEPSGTEAGAAADAPATAQPQSSAATAEAPTSQTPVPGEQAPAAVAKAPAAETPLAGETPPAGAPAATEAPAAAEPETDVASAPAGQDRLPAPPSADGVTEVLAPKLRSVDSAVIIRRGDSLWRISRRVYGRGVRYSTIYLANQNQIEDPDRIWPGQVFKVPQKSADGEAEADYSTLGDRLTTLPKEGGQAPAPGQAQ